MNILTYGDIKLIDAPEAKQVADEVITNDCYRIGTIPKDCTVIDVGAFYGEFAIACANRGHPTFAFEPALSSFGNLLENLILNPTVRVEPFNIGVHDFDGMSFLNFDKDHPAGSKLAESGHPVWVCTIHSIFDSLEGPFAVKLDCEGAEKEIFRNTHWLDSVNWLAIEWHNSDGDFYADILGERGFFRVEMSCDGTNSGGILHARRI
jgi:FkbM family methyltransferase